jgi:hypothetical protein
MRNWLEVLAIAAVLAFLALACFAEPPPGTDLNSPSHKWWECHKVPISPGSCCSEADGHVLSDKDWGITNQLAHPYKVRIEGKWWDVPREHVIADNDGCGPDPNDDTASQAKAWYYVSRGSDGNIKSVAFYCFLAGTMY